MPSTRVAAEMLGVSESTVRLLCRNGELAGKKSGRSWIVTTKKLMIKRITVSELANLTNFTRRYVQSLCKNGALISKKIGRRWYINRDDSQKFIEMRGIID